jgi:hypothetical protein
MSAAWRGRLASGGVDWGRRSEEGVSTWEESESEKFAICVRMLKEQSRGRGKGGPLDFCLSNMQLWQEDAFAWHQIIRLAGGKQQISTCA